MKNESEYRKNLHQGARPSTHKNANELRRRETDAEKKLWAAIRGRKLKGKKFRRQHPIDKYILDFYCHECKLGIELDGAIHNEKMNVLYDRSRTDDLNAIGITILRFKNEDVMLQMEKVLLKIEECL